jgi:hypothetical protein
MRRRATERACAVVDVIAGRAGLVISLTAAVADGGSAEIAQGIGSDDTGSPAGSDWRQDLHHQRQHDDRKKFP